MVQEKKYELFRIKVTDSSLHFERIGVRCLETGEEVFPISGVELANLYECLMQNKKIDAAQILLQEIMLKKIPISSDNKQ